MFCDSPIIGLTLASPETYVLGQLSELNSVVRPYNYRSATCSTIFTEGCLNIPITKFYFSFLQHLLVVLVTSLNIFTSVIFHNYS